MKRFRSVLLLLLAAGSALGQAPAERSAEARVRTIRQDPRYQRALEFLEGDYNRFVSELIELTEIPAPPFMEEERARVYLDKFQKLGLDQARIDAEGNVTGERGAGSGPFLAVAAHLDTVFPEGTDVRVRREGTRLYAPGVLDDATGLATLLAVIRAMDAAQIRTVRDILFVGDVGEEGPGDLRGVKYLFSEGFYRNRIAQFVSVEGGRQGDITTAALGSRRYRVTFSGPGGHSYSAFGLVNPAFALGNAIEKFSRLTVPGYPKTTFNVGVVGGGTSVNSIPSESWMEVDIRSEATGELDQVTRQFFRLMQEAADEENRARSTGQGRIRVDVELIGERPSGETPLDSSIVQMTGAAYRAFGIEPSYSRSSTDSNIPISLGIPAVTIDRGGTGGRSHSLEEWADVEKASTVKGLRVVLTTILALAGLDE